jgi:hypothetical protein
MDNYCICVSPSVCCDELRTVRHDIKAKDDALALAWDALRWAESPDEGDPCDQWTEIPRDRAQKAFEAIWDALGCKTPVLDADMVVLEKGLSV